MPVRSVESYREAEKKGNTLAVGNLAHLLIDAGFVPEAKEEQNTERLKAAKDAAEAYLKERREAEQNVTGGLTEGLDLKRKAAKKFYSGMGIYGQTDEEIDAADLASKKKAQAATVRAKRS